MKTHSDEDSEYVLLKCIIFFLRNCTWLEHTLVGKMKNKIHTIIIYIILSRD